jgi:hypothetical protein
MNSIQTHPPVTREDLHQNDWKIALQSALAAALSLGLPAGLLFWLITIQSLVPSAAIERLVAFLQDYAVPPVILEMLGAFVWGVLLSKISGYRRWWWLSVATMAGVWAGNFALYHGWLPEWILALAPRGFSPPVQLRMILAVNVLSVTISTGLLLGLTLRSWKASLMLAGSTGAAATLAAVVTLMILDGLGIRVGSGHAAMPKVTAAATMAAALAGGAILGVMFSRYARAGFSQEDAIAE